jgi:glutamate formiminotransferase
MPKHDDRGGDASSPLAECVINVSEGRDQACLRELARIAEAPPGAALLHWDADTDHHRTVFTLAGSLPGLEAAAAALCRRAVDLLDLSRHLGVHPRIGAVDVIPFVPIRGVSMSDCIRSARRLGTSLAEEIQLPVYLYEQAATRRTRKSLAELRRGGLESLRRRMARDPDWTPDFGPPRPHPTAGVSCVGARDYLIAYNMYLEDPDLTAARKVAARIRERDGGLPGVKALGLWMASRNQAQVSTNLTDFRRTSLVRLFEVTDRHARELGTRVYSSEIVGLAPQDALGKDATVQLRLENPASESILEERIRRAWPGIHI